MSGRHNNRRQGKGRKHRGSKPPLDVRIKQSLKDRGMAQERTPEPIVNAPRRATKDTMQKDFDKMHTDQKRPGFFRRIFNRKVG